jgi:hypothetical protein
MRSFRFLAAGVIAVGLVVSTPSVASAAWTPPVPNPQVISDALAAPFNLSLQRNQVLVADGGLGIIGDVAADGSVATVVEAEGAEGVAHGNGRSFAYTTTITDGDTFTILESGLHISASNGSTLYADTLAYEQANNPDGAVTYGVVGQPSQCVIDALTGAGLPVTYTGVVDSHAYSVASLGNAWIVADAAANALLSVDRKGNIRTLAVLPPQPVEITSEAAAAFGLDPCVVGTVYTFEPVPTDVEIGIDGQLYVSLLPGGPESPVLGARGSVYKVNPWTGSFRVEATGFLGATNVAVGLRREIYVAELFGGRISVVRNGQTSELVSLPGVVAVEFGSDGSLWASTLGDEASGAPGTLVKVSDGRSYWLGGR